MNLLTKNILLLIIIMGWITGLTAQDCKSRISVLTNHPQSVIILNNNTVGNGSVILELEKGKYSLVVREDNLSWNSQIFKDSLTVADCNSKELHYNFRNEVYLNTTPVSAGVFHNDSLIGYTPLYLNSLDDFVEIKKENYKTERITLNGEKYSLINLQYVGPGNGSSFFRTNLFKLLLGTALTLGGTAAYFKLQADDEYEKYQITKDPAYLDKTDKYDLISGIAFGALQINFGLLIYYFLTD